MKFAASTISRSIASKPALALLGALALLSGMAQAAPGENHGGANRGESRGDSRGEPRGDTRGSEPRGGEQRRTIEPRGGREIRGDRDARTGGEYRSNDRGPANGYVFDSRFHHDRYYPPRGYVVSHLDRDARVVFYGNDRYYYRGGAWYRPFGPRWRVVAPPIGLVVPFLPDFYSTIWFGGVPYYYANDSYYLWRSEARGYVVVDPPESSRSSAAPAPDPADDLYVYPVRGQSDEMQSRDRYECHRWAVTQTGFDPSEPGGGVSESQNLAKRADYRRAITACLEGRGYSVK